MSHDQNDLGHDVSIGLQYT